MKLIADIGGTSGRWVLLKDNHVTDEFSTNGFHPLQQDPSDLSELILKSPLWALRDEISEVYYYGTAATIGESSSIITDVLGACFAFGQINVHNDIQAIAHASGEQNCIVCIMGTGSSSALVINGRIHSRITSLGYALGDEGSGADLGKRIIKSHYYKQLSQETSKLLLSEFELSDTQFISTFYSSEKPAALLASLAPFIIAHKKRNDIAKIITDSFTEFYDAHILNYSSPELPIICSGGIAFNLQSEWKKFLISKGHKSLTIIQDPVKGLIERYKNE